MTQTQSCPSCGAAAGASRFCPECGVALRADCAGCGAPLPAGARFCNECGRPVSGEAQAEAAGGRGPLLPWAVAGLALVALVAFVLVQRGGAGDEPAAAPAPMAGAAAPGAGPGAVDLSSMTPREAADRLFNRVMTFVSQGDTAQARQFVPMALMAYQRVPDLDLDARYHLASLQMVAGDPASARAQADSILAAHPQHLFGLFMAGEAESSRGDTDEANRLYRRFLQAYDAEQGADRPEYRDHAQSLPLMKEAAERAVAGS